MKCKTKILTVLAGLLIGGVACTLCFVSSDAIAEDRFARVSNGMTKAQIRELLGAPHRERRDSPDRTAYFYGGFQHLKWCSMEVFFGADGRVTGQFHDH